MGVGETAAQGGDGRKGLERRKDGLALFLGASGTGRDLSLLF